MTSLRAAAARLWRALCEPGPDVLGIQLLRLTVVLLVAQLGSLALALATEYSFESWLLNLSISAGLVGGAITTFGFVQTLRWLMRQS